MTVSYLYVVRVLLDVREIIGVVDIISPVGDEIDIREIPVFQLQTEIRIHGNESGV